MNPTVWVVVCHLVGSAGAPDKADATADLIGTVRAEDGKPIGGATVTIWTAGPRKGIGLL